MSQGEKVKNPKEKKKVPRGRSVEEMKERPDMAVEEDTDEMKRQRNLNQSERMEEESPGHVQCRREQERSLQRQR